MGLSIVLASVHIEENEKISFPSLYECFNISQPASISAFPWISLLWIETSSRQGKTGDHTNIRRREKAGIGISPKIVSIFAQSGGWDIGYQCVLLESDFVSKFAKKSDLDL